MYKNFFKLSAIFISLAFFLTFGSGALVAKYFLVYANKPTYEVQKVVVEIPYGSSLRAVAKLLAQNGVIADSNNFYWYLRLGRSDGHKIQAGYYEFYGQYSYEQLASRLLLGQDRSYLVTIKEGDTLVDIARILAEHDLVKEEDFISAMNSESVLAAINAPNQLLRKGLKNEVGGLEGYLFPDSYLFSKKDSATKIILSMHQRLKSLLTPDMYLRMKELNVSLHELLTLASIIEKETGSAVERPLISSVYQNRLRIGMRLQADPTVIYGIKDYQGKIRKSDLLAYHPYNTYKVAGLPPGPIAAPGILSIRAVLWPKESKYLFFVSKNDGSHVFCENLSCHNQAVKTWQIEYFKNRAAR